MQQCGDRARPWGVDICDEVEVGVDDAAAAFAEERGGWLIRCAYLLTGNRQAAEDLTQDTLLAVWRNWPKVAQADNRDAYVARIMLNTMRSKARRRRIAEVPYDDPPPPRGVTGADPMTSLDDADQIWHAMGSLTSRQRTVLVLRYWADMDDASIAAVVRCRRATVRSLAARGIATLRTTIGEVDD